MNKKFENYSVEQLETIITRLYIQKIKKGGYLSQKKEDELEGALYTRKWKINQTFEWTPENREKLLCLNQKLIEGWEKLTIEAKQTIETLQSVKNKFLHEFLLEAKIGVEIYIPDENGEFYQSTNCIEEVFSYLLLVEDKYRYAVNFHHYLSDEESSFTDILYLNREQNWSDDPCFKRNFDGHFISQAIHDLYDHTFLSFPDILKINYLKGELQTNLHRYVDMWNCEFDKKDYICKLNLESV